VTSLNDQGVSPAVCQEGFGGKHPNPPLFSSARLVLHGILKNKTGNYFFDSPHSQTMSRPKTLFFVLLPNVRCCAGLP
jgi:hypothetical protein